MSHFSTTGFASLLLLFRQQLSPQRLQLRRTAGALVENVLHNARIAATESAAAVFAYDVGRLAHLLANDSDRSPDLAGAQWHHHWRCALLGRANRLERRVESSGASSSCWRGVGSGRRGLHHVGRGRRVRPWPTCPGEKSQIQVVFMNTLYSAVYSATAQIHV